MKWSFVSLRFVIAAVVAVTVAGTFAQAPQAARDLDAMAGREALLNGDVQEARTRFEAAVKRYPADHAMAFIYAQALPFAGAMRVIDSLFKIPGMPGWVNAQCLRFYGDHRYAKEDYKKAADLYQQAFRFDSLSVYRYLQALALAMDGQQTKAAEILYGIAVVSSDPMGGEAAVLLELMKKKGLIADLKPPFVKQQDDPSAQNIIFTIQVGAFGTRENADNFVKKLSGKYKDVTVSEAASGESTLFRVRVGTFNNRDDAQTFADKLITEEGMSARVVER